MPKADLESVPTPPASPQGSDPQPIEDSTFVENPSSEHAGEGEESLDARAERLAKIKAAIDAGDYETPDKLEIALSRLFGEIDLDEDE